jgi:hypothetical protein
MIEPLSLLIFTIDTDPPGPDKPSSSSPTRICRKSLDRHAQEATPLGAIY